MSDKETAHLAGKLEANLTASLMEMQWKNTMGTYCTDDPDLCEKMIDFVLENSMYIRAEENDSDPLQWSSDPDRWYQVGRRPKILLLLLLLLHYCYCCCTITELLTPILLCFAYCFVLFFQVNLFYMQVAGLADGYRELGLTLLPQHAFK